MPLIFSHLHLLDLYQPKTFFKGGGGGDFFKVFKFLKFSLVLLYYKRGNGDHVCLGLYY